MPDPQQPRDLVSFTPRDHDVRIERAGWTYYVRGVKHGESLHRNSTWDGTLVGLVGFIVIKAVAWAFFSRVQTWKVGVIRWKNSKLGGRIRVVYKETLPPDTDPVERIADLARRVNEGEFDA